MTLIVYAVNLFVLIVALRSTICYSFQFDSFSRGSSTYLLAADISSLESVDQQKSESFRAPINEIERRRNFAIISHPDAGRTFSYSESEESE